MKADSRAAKTAVQKDGSRAASWVWSMVGLRVGLMVGMRVGSRAGMRVGLRADSRVVGLRQMVERKAVQRAG